MKLKIYNIMCRKDYAQDGSSSTEIRHQLAPHCTDVENMSIALSYANKIACEDMLKYKKMAVASGISIEDFPQTPTRMLCYYSYNIDSIGVSAMYYVVETEVDLSFSPGVFARDEFDNYDTSHLSDKDVDSMVYDAEEMLWNSDAFLNAFDAVKNQIVLEYKLTRRC